MRDHFHLNKNRKDKTHNVINNYKHLILQIMHQLGG